MAGLALSLVNLAFFIAVAIYGYHRDVNYPFPAWFNNIVGWSLNTTLVLILASVVGLFNSRSVLKSVFALLVNLACLFLMAFLLTKG